MPIIDDSSAIRCDHPTETNAWFSLRPLTAGDLETRAGEFQVVNGEVKLGIGLIAACLVSWSYKVPPTEEFVRKLDLDTMIWATQQVMAISRITTGAEKKDETTLSSPGQAPDEARSLENSVT